MGRNASLDEFGTDGLPTTPIAPVQRYRPDGASCDRCDDHVEELWLDGGTAVCRTCRDW